MASREPNDAATDLGVIEAHEGHLQRAVELWRGAFSRLPHRSAIGLNLAMIYCGGGQVDIAKKYLEEILTFNPDSTEARKLNESMGADPVRCKP